MIIVHDISLSLDFIQKGSIYLDDFNYFIDMRIQMGFSFEKNIELYIPNATKCWTWNDVKKSHHDDNVPVIKLEDIIGLIILLAVGFGGAMTILTIESCTRIVLRKQSISNK